MADRCDGQATLVLAGCSLRLGRPSEIPVRHAHGCREPIVRSLTSRCAEPGNLSAATAGLRR